MKISLQSIKIDNFKGLKQFFVVLDGKSATITGQNAKGKTTIYDAFLWLLFSKDSEGKPDSGKGAFGIRPLDKNNDVIKGLVVSVSATFDFDGDIHTFRKEQHEKFVKDQLAGYETQCWIDDVPKKVGEFAAMVQTLFPESIFKMLTDLRYFAEKLHWQERRKVLLEMAGKLADPPGFETLLTELTERRIAIEEIDDYKNLLASEKKLCKKERDQIEPRIDELQKGLSEYAENGDSQLELENQRKVLEIDVEQLDAERQAFIDQEQQRQQTLDKINELKNQQANRATAVASDTTAVQPLIAEKVKLDEKIAETQQSAEALKQKLETKLGEKANTQEKLKDYQRAREEIRLEYDKVKAQTDVTVCYACGQQLPADKLEEQKIKKAEKLEQLESQGNQAKKDIEDITARLDAIENEKGSIIKMHSEATKAAVEAMQKAEKRKPEIDEAINNRQAPNFEKDAQWLALKEQIEKLQLTVAPSASAFLKNLEEQRKTKSDKVTELGKLLAQADRAKQDKARIDELTQKEQDLSQQLNNIDRSLSWIANYKAAQSKLLEQAVNDKFKYVTHKLFEQQLNGEFINCCDTILDGVPYSDMSSGQKIFAGLDIVNALSSHYGFAMPLFIDHSESMTLPIEAFGQTIKLVAKPDTELTVEIN